MIELSDLEVGKAARELTSNPNCSVLLTENMDWKNTRKCMGRFEVHGNKVKIIDSCGEPCSFVCDTSREFEKNMWRVRSILRIINLIKGI